MRRAAWEARARAARVQTAGEDLWWWWWWQQLRITSGRLPLIGGSFQPETYDYRVDIILYDISMIFYEIMHPPDLRW